MSKRPFLILDCYYDEVGAAPNFRALLGEESSRVVRVVREALPGKLTDFRGILITGSKGSLTDPEPWMERLLGYLRRGMEEEIPILGICFGHQAIAVAVAGGQAVRKAPRSELGWETIRIHGDDPLLHTLPRNFTCFVSHFDEVTPGTPGFRVLASSDRCKVEGLKVQDRPVWGLQFHPEMDPLESETLVRTNLMKHATLGNSVERVLSGHTDARELGRRIFQNFIERCAPEVD